MSGNSWNGKSGDGIGTGTESETEVALLELEPGPFLVYSFCLSVAASEEVCTLLEVLSHQRNLHLVMLLHSSFCLDPWKKTDSVD